jgi:hypothetical protein
MKLVAQEENLCREQFDVLLGKRNVHNISEYRIKDNIALVTVKFRFALR